MAVQPSACEMSNRRAAISRAMRVSTLHNAIAHVRNCERTRRSVAAFITAVVSLGRCARKGAADRDMVITFEEARAYVRREPLESLLI